MADKGRFVIATRYGCCVAWLCLTAVFISPACALEPGATADARPVTFGPYEYEVKPDDEAFRGFNPRRAPKPGPLLLAKGDRLAICGDSITEQKMYSRLMETYLTACVPELEVTCRQYGWSGERTNGFLNRMDKDCLTFEPTVATLAYGMNDSNYRPFDVTNGRWYEDHYRAIVRRFKNRDVRVVVGSPGCAGKIATWVRRRAGTLEQHNVHLCALRDIALGVAEQEDVRFADIFWPMYQAQVLGPAQHGASADDPYLVAGEDGIHPGWAGHVLMAWSMLRALGLDGEIGTIEVDLSGETAEASAGHRVDSFVDGVLTLTSERYAFCTRGDADDWNSIRSGATLVPFHDDLNRFVLRVTSDDVAGTFSVQWGENAREFSAAELSDGVNLAAAFPESPFGEAFERVSAAVGAKQAYETVQIKKRFHSREARDDFASVVRETEAEREPLVAAVSAAMRPVTHTVVIRRVVSR